MKNKKSDELKIIIFGESYSNYQIYVVIHVQLENKKLRFISLPNNFDFICFLIFDFNLKFPFKNN